MSLNSKLK